jgi:putative aminopeptidase FrvX
LNLSLLETLCAIHATSGDEHSLTQFLVEHISSTPDFGSDVSLHYGKHLHDTLVVAKGAPTTVIFCHIDSVGFMTRYDNKLTLIGGPECEHGTPLIGKWQSKMIKAKLVADESGDLLCLDLQEKIPPGIRFMFDANFIVTQEYVQSPFLDNRLGVFMALQILQQSENVLIAFSTYEEHGGGSVPFLLRFVCDRWAIQQALVLDVTWATEGVKQGGGVVISLRDRNIPRQQFVDQLIDIAKQYQIPFQLEVEEDGSSDGRELQHSQYAIDWCFVGPPEINVHTPREQVFIHDINSTIQFYLACLQHFQSVKH